MFADLSSHNFNSLKGNTTNAETHLLSISNPGTITNCTAAPTIIEICYIICLRLNNQSTRPALPIVFRKYMYSPKNNNILLLKYQFRNIKPNKLSPNKSEFSQFSIKPNNSTINTKYIHRKNILKDIFRNCHFSEFIPRLLAKPCSWPRRSVVRCLPGCVPAEKIIKERGNRNFYRVGKARSLRIFGYHWLIAQSCNVPDRVGLSWLTPLQKLRLHCPNLMQWPNLLHHLSFPTLYSCMKLKKFCKTIPTF